MLTKKGSGHKEKRRMVIRSEESVDDYLKQPYARILIPEADGTFSAEVLELPGCYAEGETADEAYRNLEAAAKSWIAVELARGQNIPPPSANHGYSGRIVLRLPRDLHRLAARKAQRDGVSLNQCLVTAVAAWVGADNLFERIAERVQVRVQVNWIQRNLYLYNPVGSVALPAEPWGTFYRSVLAVPALPSSSNVPAVGNVGGWTTLAVSSESRNPSSGIDRAAQGPVQQMDAV